MKLFEPQMNLTSYSYPVVKIILSLAMILLCIFRNQIIHFSSAWANVLLGILCFAITMASILCLYISILELFNTHENRRKAKPGPVKQLTMESVIKLVTENDIVEIEVCTGERIIKIGASADCKYASSVFENKLFYISATEYESIESFTEALLSLFPQGAIPVSKVDDLPLEN